MGEKNAAPATPSVLQWARVHAGYAVDDVAKKLKVSTQRVLAWEAGNAEITFGRLDDLAHLYKRPSALFFMPRPPAEEPAPLADFRDLGGAAALSPGLIYQVRRARERHDAAAELADELGEAPPAFTFTCEAVEDPARAGARLRALLGVTMEHQRQWAKDATGYRALNAWKEAVEGRGVLVFQAPKRDMGKARGFSIHAEVWPAAVLSAEETPAGRLFSLLHELAHLGLRQGGVCDLHDSGIEAFCNKVAAAALMPKPELVVEVKRVAGAHPVTNAHVATLAKTFGASQQAVALRLEGLALVDADFYGEHAALYRSLAKSVTAREAGPIPQETLAIARNGRGFTTVVLDAYHRGAITERRASRYLGISYEHLPNVEHELTRRGT